MTSFAERLPERVFSAAQVRDLERLAIETLGVTDYDLMCRAGAAALAVIEQRWPKARSLAVVCGAGNNAGDGLVVARLAQAAGLGVTVLLVAPAERFRGAAARAAAAAREAGLTLSPFVPRALRAGRRRRRRVARHRPRAPTRRGLSRGRRRRQRRRRADARARRAERPRRGHAAGRTPSPCTLRSP